MYTIYINNNNRLVTTEKQIALYWINKGCKFSYSPQNDDYNYWKNLEIV